VTVADVVRTPLSVRADSRRTLIQRLFLRFPGAARAYARAVYRLSPRSRLRRVALRRGFELATEAVNRRDLDAALLGYHPEREFHPPREFVDAGFFQSCYRGPAGLRNYVSEWSEVWGTDLRLEPEELIDLGNRIVVLAELPTRARASGIPLDAKWAGVMTVRDGDVIHQQDYLDQAEALAAGLSG
jgi:ketosteroid isomerase-like protein